MSEIDRPVPSAFQWSVGAWFGSQIGSTVWLAVLGLVVLARDEVSAVVAMVGFVALNVWGGVLWTRRKRWSAYTAQQAFLAAAAVVVGVIVVVIHQRGTSHPPAEGELVSTWLPYWVIGIVPLLMLVFALRERAVRAGTRRT